MLMHLQATVEYDKFARALSIGAETMVMDFRPDEPMHNRYAVSHDFLSPSAGHQAVAISRIVNAFFGWEFNSCEMLVKGDDVYPIDYANACPDVAVTSLHYYFPWAISALVKLVGLLTRDRPAQQDRPAHRAVLRDRRRRVARLRRQARRLSGPRRRALRDREVPRVVRRAPARLRRPRPRVGRRRRLRPPAPEDRRRRPIPSHEQEEFLSHFKGLTNLWLSDQASGSRET